MKLFRWKKGDRIFPGIILNDIYYDVSSFGEDYNENFFETNGLQRLGSWLEKNKKNLKRKRSRSSSRTVIQPAASVTRVSAGKQGSRWLVKRERCAYRVPTWITSSFFLPAMPQ